jgi:hypothetical protein
VTQGRSTFKPAKAARFAAAIAALPAPAIAARGQVDLRFDGSCPTIREPALMELWAIEFAPAADPAPAASRTRRSLWIRCQESGARLEVVDPRTGASLSRFVDLSGAPPDTRERLLVLAAVELVTAGSYAPGPTPDPSPPRRPAPRPRAWQMVPALAVRTFVPGFTTSVGAAVGLWHRPHRRLGWGTGIQGDHAGAATSSGRVTAWGGSVALFVLVHGGSRRWHIDGGVGPRAGVARFSGRAYDREVTAEEAFVAPWVGAAGTIAASYRARERLVLAAVVEAGWVILPAVALSGQDRALAMANAWIQLGLGVGWML